MKRKHANRGLYFLASMALACAIALCGFNMGALVTGETAYAEPAIQITAMEPVSDPSPAIYVAQKNAASVVGVFAYTQDWDRSTGEVKETLYSLGSGVVIAEGGYVLTNYHVTEGGDSFSLLMPDGEEAGASLVGSDSSLDLAVLQVNKDYRDQLIPAAIGSSSSLIVGSTVIAIGNPGGEHLANTVTQGIVSALERSEVYSTNTTRNVDYIQHDAAINSGNSGGGLFNYKGELIGINTLKYGGSAYSSVSFEGLGFAIPVDTVYPIAMQLIETGEVVRPQMGVSVNDIEGPDEPMGNYAPASVCIYTVEEGSPAQKAGLKQYDFIYAVNGQRVKTFRELTGILDRFQAGDTVTLTVVRYANAAIQQVPVSNNYNDIFGNFFGNYGFGFGGSNPGYSTQTREELVVGGGYEFIEVDVTLELPAGK